MHAQATIGFGSTSDCLKKWCENFEPINEWSNHKPKKFANYFRHSIDTQLRTALCGSPFPSLFSLSTCLLFFLMYQIVRKTLARTAIPDNTAAVIAPKKNWKEMLFNQFGVDNKIILAQYQDSQKGHNIFKFANMFRHMIFGSGQFYIQSEF